MTPSCLKSPEVQAGSPADLASVLSFTCHSVIVPEIAQIAENVMGIKS